MSTARTGTCGAPMYRSFACGGRRLPGLRLDDPSTPPEADERTKAAVSYLLGGVLYRLTHFTGRCGDIHKRQVLVLEFL
jgi:hypothetical protein